MGKEFDPGGWQRHERRVFLAKVGIAAAYLATFIIGQSVYNQITIDRDTAILRTAAGDDGVIIEQLASGMQDAGDKRSVIADIVVQDCLFNGAKLIIAKDTPDIEEYLLSVGNNTVSTTDVSDLDAQLPGLLSTCSR